jgi:hypothetical protein
MRSIEHKYTPWRHAHSRFIQEVSLIVDEIRNKTVDPRLENPLKNYLMFV